ncbi:hypothetical protein FisN_14Hu219 [Fistulifera solaris]|jgi:hypothetical protein|uniref:Uncharacterized protein n=1 Tax=Fistulifera solaris TaxID=1519565 RepID=A0A1Z5K8N7_FISSO|nr:hypothetical protein FisN_14Hu219 [Fistulifera solaris]|eukprot:GAX22587.1 hypothetical protein FisN_14Hu219 [Fistulifera solaris]
MSYDVPASLEPILDTELDPVLQKELFALFEESCNVVYNEAEVEDVGVDYGEVFAVPWIQHIKEAVSAHPILTRTIFTNDKRDMRSLLYVVCEKFSYAGPDITRFLIEANPHALVWERHEYSKKMKLAPIHLIANHARSCDLLLPWILECYPWVFEHNVCQKKKPHFDMIRWYANQQISNVTIRKFYELNPQGLREKDSTKFMGGYPLVISLSGSEMPDADTFIWMAEQYPKAVHHRTEHGYTLLHEVCSALAERDENLEFSRRFGIELDDFGFPNRCTPNVAKICRYLISEHSDLVRQQICGHGYLPIHMLANRCNRPLVQEVLILLLKAYPGCINIKAGKFRPELSTVPFIQQVYPLILDELDVDEEFAMLPQIAENITEVATRTTLLNPVTISSLLDSVSEVFRLWARSRISDALVPRKQSINDRIADTCRLFEGEDRYEDRYDEFRGDEYRAYRSVATLNNDKRGENESSESEEDDASSHESVTRG